MKEHKIRNNTIKDILIVFIVNNILYDILYSICGAKLYDK